MKIIVILLTLIVLFLLYIICFITINKKETSKNTEQKEPQNHKNISKNNIEKNSTASTRSSKSTKNTSTRNTSRMKWRNKTLNISMIPKTVELDKNTLLPQSIKREMYDSNWVELQSINTMYAPRRFEGEDLQRIRVFGIVRKIIRNYDN